MDDREIDKALSVFKGEYKIWAEEKEGRRKKIKIILSVLSFEWMSTRQIVNRCDSHVPKMYWTTIRGILERLRDCNLIEKNDLLTIIQWRLKRRRNP